MLQKGFRRKSKPRGAIWHVQGAPESMLHHTRAELKCRLVQAALARLVHECDDQKCRHRPWDMWFDQNLVKDGDY